MLKKPPKIRMVCSTTAALPMASGRTLAINSQYSICQLLLGIIPGNNCLGGMFFVHNCLRGYVFRSFLFFLLHFSCLKFGQ